MKYIKILIGNVIVIRCIRRDRQRQGFRARIWDGNRHTVIEAIKQRRDFYITEQTTSSLLKQYFSFITHID